MLNACSGSVAPQSHRQRPVVPTAPRSVICSTPPAVKDVVAPPIKAGRTTFQKIGLADIQPGDIGFQVQRRQRNFKQFWITVGGRWAAWRRPVRSDPYVVHSFVVVEPHPCTKQLHTVDGAGDNYTGINDVMMSFGPTKVRVVPGGRYVFFRARDLDLSARILQGARNWAQPQAHNFGYRRAVESPFHSLRFDKRARRRMAVLAPQARIHGAPKRANGEKFKMSCGEFVANVIATAVISKWQDEHPHAQGDNLLQGLYTGALGKDFAVDTKGVHPAQLESMVENANFWQPVGYLTENG